jgi:polysaccharide deacetylase family protein (PEP-CTERM system associated)
MRTNISLSSRTSSADSAASGAAEAVDGRWRNAMTVDVEDYFHVAALSGSIDRKDWANLPARVDANTRRLLDIFDAHDVRATFFVLGWVSERFPQLIGEIHRRGHEVACHGLSHKLIYDQSPAEFQAETVRSKELLQEITGAPIAGYRAASYSITKDSLWALDIIAEAGFKYDSSIVPVRHDLYGIPGSQREPHRLSTQNGAELVEFPPSTVRMLGQDIPVGGGGYFRLYPYALTRRLLNSINVGRRQPFIFYIHPWEIDAEQPRIKTNPISRFRHYLNLEKCELRLDRLMQDFRFSTVADVLAELAPLPLCRASGAER